MFAVGWTCGIRVCIRVMRHGRLGTINWADRLAILTLDACHVQTVKTATLSFKLNHRESDRLSPVVDGSGQIWSGRSRYTLGTINSADRLAIFTLDACHVQTRWASQRAARCAQLTCQGCPCIRQTAHTQCMMNPCANTEQGRKSARPQGRKSARPQVSQPARPQVSKAARPQVSKAARPQVSKAVRPHGRNSARPQGRKSARTQGRKSARRQASKAAPPLFERDMRPM